MKNVPAEGHTSPLQDVESSSDDEMSPEQIGIECMSLSLPCGVNSQILFCYRNK